MRFRRSPYLVAYWADGGLTFTNYATNTHVLADANVAALLEYLGAWRSLAALERQFPQFSPTSVRRAVDLLEQQSLIRRSTTPASRTESALRPWADWLPAAAWFHLSTKDVTYRTVKWSAPPDDTGTPPPSFLKRSRGGRQVILPRTNPRGEFAQVLQQRRTWRRFSTQPIKASSLSTLLELTWGIQQWGPGRRPQRVPLKTSPSGGARHPIEVYALIRHVAGVPAGLYHYRSDAHRLELLSAAPAREKILRYLPTQYWYADACAIFIMTAVFAREQWRYKIPRAYRAVLIEAGHLCQTFCLVATWLGLAPFCTLALADSLIERDLGIDGVSESVLYVAGAGTRPAGVAWAPTPAPRRAMSRNGQDASASRHRSRTF